MRKRTWTAYHEYSLNIMLNREYRVCAERIDRPLVNRIRKCLQYLRRRDARKD